MRIGIIYLWLCLLGGPVAMAQQAVSVYPVPQQMNLKEGKLTIPARYELMGTETANPYAVSELKKLLSGENGENEDFVICIGERGDKAVREYARMIPRYSEGYYLLVEKGRIVLAGNDERGTYYAVQTLAQLMQDGQLPQVEIKDYPTVHYRGVVEGFYGTPWSHQARLKQLEFYGKNKMNTYIYGPKDDPYHSCPNWRKPYPEKEAQQISELVKMAKQNEVDFVWAIHPGQDIQWNDADRDLLLGKFGKMYDLGVRAFAVFFDDISGEGTNPTRQADLLNYIDNHFVKVKGDVKPLVMCPTEYNKSWSDPAKGYLATLGTKLNPSVQIMWTGDRVMSDITEEGLKWVNEKIKRPAYIWWNFPVSDYVRAHLLMGAVYGLDTHVGKLMSGFVSNPMEYAEASKVAIFCVADYAWNPARFNSTQSWKAAVRYILPQDAGAFQMFVDHNSDPGLNGHGYRRDESVEIQPVVARFLADYRKGTYASQDFDLLADEFDQMMEAADVLLMNTENKDLIGEITPWLHQFKLMGEAGKESMAFVKAIEGGQKELAMRKYKHLKALQLRSFKADQTYNQNPYQPGVKTGSKIIQPLIDTLFVLATQRLNQQTGSQLSSDIYTSPHHAYSTVPQCKNLPIRVQTNRVIISPMLEVVKWGAGEYLGIELNTPANLESVEADFGMKDCAGWMQLEVSLDGETWKSLPVIQNGNQLKSALEGTTVRYIRIVNKSGKGQEAYLRKFIVTLKG